MNLAADIRAYVTERRDSKRERDLLHAIRALPRAERLQALAPSLELNARTTLELIDRAQLPQSDYSEILKRGLREADASSVTLWLRATVPHLGWRKVFQILRKAAAPWPSGGAFAIYHLPYCFAEFLRLPSQLQPEFCRLIEMYDGLAPLPFLDREKRKTIAETARRKSDRRTSHD